jgi:hypothetical protein
LTLADIESPHESGTESDTRTYADLVCNIIELLKLALKLTNLLLSFVNRL